MVVWAGTWRGLSVLVLGNYIVRAFICVSCFREIEGGVVPWGISPHDGCETGQYGIRCC